MATLAGDNFLSVSQSFFSPDILQKISNEINQPVEQTKAGLKSVIPALFMGILNKGSTKEGADSLIDMASKEVTGTPPIENPETIKVGGNDVLSGIFGSNLNSVVTKLGDVTGMNSGSITKMLKMAAPMIMGMLGSKIRSEKMGPSALMSFLSQQKSALSAMLPAGMPAMAGMPDVKEKLPGKTGWLKIIAAILIIAGAVYAINRTLFRSENTIAVKTVPSPAVSSPRLTPLDSVSMLETFIESDAATGAVKTFRFEQLRFNTGSAAIASGSEFEINQIVALMKANPSMTVKIEGYTDNVGSVQGNMNLSKARATNIKNKLVAKGIKNSRIQAMGLGAARPAASNNTEEGRAANRRIELVVRK